MTALDRAFMKAFGETDPAAPPRREQPPSSVEPRVTKPATLTAAPLPTAPVTIVEPTPEPERRLKPSAPVAPLSAFTPAPKIHDAIHALFEVDHFAWPETCGTLLTEARAGWDAFAEQLAGLIARGKNCLAITGCHRGEGRTTVTLATAKHLAGRGLNCLVVDADFEHPQLADHCGISPQTGWGETLSGELPLGEALIKAAEDGVTLMPWRGPEMPIERLTESLRAGNTFNMLRDRYDLVLLDCGPLSNATSIHEFADFAASICLDEVFLVSDARSPAIEQLAEVGNKLRRAGIHVQGIIENFGPLASDEGALSDEPLAALQQMAPAGTSR